jgi:hypothetical protein
MAPGRVCRVLSIAGAVTATAVVFLLVKAERERRGLAREVRALGEQLRQATLELRDERARRGAACPSKGPAGPGLERAAPLAEGEPHVQSRSRTLH